MRVLNPTNEPINGIILAQTPHRNKTVPYQTGYDLNFGGILRSVELITVPDPYLQNIGVQCDCASASIHVNLDIVSNFEKSIPMLLNGSVCP